MVVKKTLWKEYKPKNIYKCINIMLMLLEYVKNYIVFLKEKHNIMQVQ